jgi:indolepyruvate ferredoxin oxidoreductase
MALGGIGCHGMAAMLPERHTMGATPMGCEGANWIGQSPFTTRTHIFQNLGDGTYYHSGILAIRASLSAGVNVTYKILANDAVAMTGGQAVEGNVTAPAIVQQVVAEGVTRVAVVTDDPGKYPRHAFPSGVTVHHRRELDEIQRQMRDEPGVTAIVYDQACAAEKRRLRKRKQLVDPSKRLVINELVCEGCGDCNVQSNCISIEPLETEFGRKRRIDQSTCNKDYSCLEGYCPSFVTVHGGELRSATRRAPAGGTVSRSAAIAAVADLPEEAPRFEGAQCSLLVTGVGGAGIVTLGSVVAMAAHLEGKAVSVLNVLGMAQKNGPVTSHVRIADDSDETLASRIGPGESDVILGTDPIVTGGAESLRTIAKDRTRIVLNEHVQPTSDFASHPDLSFDVGPLRRRLVRAAGADGVTSIEATRWATAIFGDAMMANMLLLGYACQLGDLPLGPGSLRRAIELNGQAVSDNQLAFDLGRMVAIDPVRVQALADVPATDGIVDVTSDLDLSDLSAQRERGVRVRTLEDKVATRAAFLTQYQNAAYARRYRDRVDAVARREEEVMGSGRDELARAAADNYFKLLAYKDEYEVARLYTDGSFRRQLDRELSGNYRIELNLAPQVFNARDKRTNRARKRTFGPWIFPVLGVMARGKRLRGTAFDPFGRTSHRRLERELITWYEQLVDELAAGLTPANHDLAVEIASIPESIRGYDTVKEESVAKARENYEVLMEQFRHPIDQHAA